MKAPPQVEVEGLRIYDKVCAFERLRSRRIPVIYCAITLLIILGGFALMMIDRPYWALTCLMLAIFFSGIAWFNWRKLSRAYAKNLQLLTELETTYGEDLPWIQVERHLVALEQLKRDLEEEKKPRPE